jgi:SAM-dependent methyltransferase
MVYIKKLGNPIHIKPEILLAITYNTSKEVNPYGNTSKEVNPYGNTSKEVNKDIFFSVKADGVYSQIKYKNYIFEAEYIKKYDLYLVFDTISYPLKHKDTYYNRIQWVRSFHNFTNNIKLDTYKISVDSDIDRLINEDNNNIINYLKTTNDKIKWFPKITFINQLNNSTFLQRLDKNIFTIYETDGWIIFSEYYGIYKYKPKHELTVDLQYINGNLYSKENDIIPYVKNELNLINGSIYRCDWINNSGWNIREVRTDKFSPNPNDIINELTNLHKNYWTSTDLIPYLSNNIYYTHDNIKIIDKNILSILDSKIFNIINTIKIVKEKYLLNQELNILDLGCGTGKAIYNIHTHHIDYKSYVGIDSDPRCIVSAYKSNKNKYIWGDFITLSGFFDKNILPTKYNMLLMVNTINYIHNSEKCFFENLEKITDANSIIIVITHNFTNDFIDINYNDSLIITQKMNLPRSVDDHDNQIYNFKYPWLNLNLNLKPELFRSEYVYKKEQLINLFKQYNWQLTDTLPYIIDIPNKILMDFYVNNTNIFLFIK